MKKYGFTIAEVLVALTIIGVISALTIPTFSANTAKSQYITAFKTTMNQLESGAQLYKAENNMDFSGTRTNTNGPDIISNMLTSKLNAKQNNATWAVSGLIGSAADHKLFITGSFETMVVDGKTYYKISKTGCKEGAQFDTTQSCTDSETCILPCWSSSDSFASKYRTDSSYVPLALTNSILKGSNTNIQIGRTEGDNLYIDRSFVLPSGVVVSILNADTANGCNFYCVRWDAQKKQYITPEYNPTTAQGAANTNLCLALVDVNGSKGPNRMVSCGTNNNYILNPDGIEACTMNKNFVNDIFPIWFYDDKVMPANSAAYTVLYGEVID